ncbi:MAG: helix-turn-helix transcriptional regulator [Pseudohongiellaceae bacterium]
MNSLLEQIKKRRITLALKQHDMLLRVGISRQQYQRLESKGNPRLDTLELIAKGLRSELLLIPQEKLNAVLAVLTDDTPNPGEPSQSSKEGKKSLADDPWQGLLGENE